MTLTDSASLAVEYSAHGCPLHRRDKDRYESMLTPLARVVDRFPSAALHVQVARSPHSGWHEVKLSLVLSGSKRLFARSSHRYPWPAFRHCVRRLVGSVTAYKEERVERRRHGEAEIPARRVRAPVEPDASRLASAAAEGDYRAFRDGIAIYRETLRKRIGRRIELSRDAASELGDGFSIDDCVEAVFLGAFDAIGRRPEPPEGLGDWLETLIDDAIRSLVDNRHEERLIVGLVRDSCETTAVAMARDSRD